MSYDVIVRGVVSPFIQAFQASSVAKVGTVGRSNAHRSGLAQMIPVPRGANIHLCVPAQKIVRAELGGLGLDGAQAMDSIDDEQDPAPLVAPAIRLLDHLSEGRNRQAHARARMHPGEPDHACRRLQGRAQAIDHLCGVRLAGTIVKRDAPRGGALPLGGEADRLVMRIVIVRGGEDLVARLKPQSVIDERQSRGRVAGERDLVALSAEVPGEILANLQLEVVLVREHAVVDGQVRIRIERLTIVFDRVSHRLWMRGDEEAREMKVAPVDRELIADSLPVGEVREGSGALLERGEQIAGRKRRGGGSRCGSEELAAREHAIPLSRATLAPSC